MALLLLLTLVHTLLHLIFINQNLKFTPSNLVCHLPPERNHVFSRLISWQASPMRGGSASGCIIFIQEFMVRVAPRYCPVPRNNTDSAMPASAAPPGPRFGRVDPSPSLRARSGSCARAGRRAGPRPPKGAKGRGPPMAKGSRSSRAASPPDYAPAATSRAVSPLRNRRRAPRGAAIRLPLPHYQKPPDRTSLARSQRPRGAAP